MGEDDRGASIARDQQCHPQEGDTSQDGPDRLGPDPRVSIFQGQTQTGTSGDDMPRNLEIHLLSLLPDLVDRSNKSPNLLLPPAALLDATQLHVHLLSSGSH